MIKRAISVIVPVYNVEKYLEKCIDSIIQQTFMDFELILVNDGSTDQSGAICEEYKKKDDRIIVIHKENSGVSAARNVALDMCNGGYIFFVDSDDYIEKNCLEFLYNKINDSTYDFVSCCANFVDEDNQFIKRNEYSKNELLINENEIFNVYMQTSFIEDAPWNKIYKKEVFENLRFTEGIIFEDSELIVRLLKKVNKVLFTSEYLYNYRIRRGSILNYESKNTEQKVFSVKKLDLLKVYESSYKELKDTKYGKKYIKRILFACSQFWSESMSLEKDVKTSVRKDIKSYYNKYKKYLFDREIFSNKECWYIIFNINFGKAFLKIMRIKK